MNQIEKLAKFNKFDYPKWLPSNIMYLTVMGSEAYGVSNRGSDIDVYGFVIPPKNIIFPHTAGIIKGFGDQGEVFDQWQMHHVKDDNNKEYDFQIFNIVKYFNLCMENNPNALDSLFTYRTCVLHSTPIGEHVKSNKKLFLHKGCYHKFRGYAYAQLSKIKNKTNSSNEKRTESIKNFGYDTKFAYHVVRLCLQVKDILTKHDMDLMAHREMLKSVRNGEWTLEKLTNWFDDQEKILEYLYTDSTLQYKPNEKILKKILFECIEMHYGSISEYVYQQHDTEILINELQKVIDKFKPRS